MLVKKKKDSKLEFELNKFKEDLKEYDHVQKALFDQFLLSSPYAIAILDKEQRIFNINENFTYMFQYTLDDIEGKFINELVSSHDNKNLVDKNIDMIYKGNVVKQEGKRKRKDGKLIYVEILGYPVIYKQSIIGVYIIYIDISHKQIDSLTRFYNRNYFLDTIDDYISDYKKSNNKFSIIAITIESFREISATLGYIIGDKLLVEISKRIKIALSENYLISRIDGDEFAVLVNSVNKNDLISLSNSIITNLEQPYLISNAKINLNFNIGICRFPMDANNSKNLIRFAIASMHKSRRTESRISFYTNEVFKEREQKFRISNYLFNALSNNELTINYQPIFDIKNKKIVGAEALLRWHNTILGDVQPDKFIPIAEKTGQIITIGEWVLKEVCRQINLWKEKGYKLKPISINISVIQLENIDFARSTINTLKNNNIDTNLIELEITEKVSSGDIAKIVKNIEELKKNGIKISMDDFGKGFSSLGQLGVFEIDKLKIDKFFIDDLANGLKVQKLVKTIIAMAESLNLVTVAEGIETNEQLHKLKGLGCQLGQGFIFSKPLKVEEIEELFEKN